MMAFLGLKKHLVSHRSSQVIILSSKTPSRTSVYTFRSSELHNWCYPTWTFYKGTQTDRVGSGNLVRQFIQSCQFWSSIVFIQVNTKKTVIFKICYLVYYRVIKLPIGWTRNIKSALFSLLWWAVKLDRLPTERVEPVFSVICNGLRYASVFFFFWVTPRYASWTLK